MIKKGRRKVTDIHQMNLKDSPFKLINNQTKTIEMRLYDEKRQKVKVGDIIEFNNLSTNEVIKTKVLALHKFMNFKELYHSFDKIALGYRENDLPDPSDMEQYYKKEEIEKFGVIGIEIRKI